MRISILSSTLSASGAVRKKIEIGSHKFINSYQPDTLVHLAIRNYPGSDIRSNARWRSLSSENRLQATFDREKRFTADASHELRTPLTAIKGRIGMILTQPRSTAQYAETLAQVETQVDSHSERLRQRLIRLTKDLLFLSRLDDKRSSLAIAYEVVRLHGGSLSVTSQIDSPQETLRERGTTFTIFLAAAKMIV
jgi:signal transduction histidine kinase